MWYFVTASDESNELADLRKTVESLKGQQATTSAAIAQVDKSPIPRASTQRCPDDFDPGVVTIGASNQIGKQALTHLAKTQLIPDADLPPDSFEIGGPPLARNYSSSTSFRM